MGDVYWGVHTPIAACIANAGIEVAVETGTYYGQGALQLASLFNQVFTIEADKKLHSFCSELYARANIRFVHGSSDKALAAIAQEIDKAAFYFLDAHWFPSASLSLNTGHQCPILEELKSLKDVGVLEKGSVIMIDDADMFLGSLPPGVFHAQDFPSLAHLVLVLQNDMKADYVDILDDVILAGPNWLEPIVAKYKIFKGIYGAPGAKRINI